MWRILVWSRNNQFVKTTIQNFRSLIMPSKSFVSSLLRNTKSSLILGGKKFSNPNFHDGICFRCWMGYNFLVTHNIALPLIFLGNIQMGFYWLKFSAIEWNLTEKLSSQTRCSYCKNDSPICYYIVYILSLLIYKPKPLHNRFL